MLAPVDETAGAADDVDEAGGDVADEAGGAPDGVDSVTVEVDPADEEDDAVV